MEKVNKKPIIGIIGRPDIASDDDKVICINENVRRSIVKKGGIPLLMLPNQDVEYENVRPRDLVRLTEEEKNDLIKIIDLCDGILIPGGYKFYEYDIFMYHHAFEKNMPILGICAGMQMMGSIDNYKIGASEISSRNETEIDHHQREEKYVHYVDILDNTLLKSIIPETRIHVNSKHNYHLNKLNEFKIAAYSEDGLIEAIEYPNKKFVLGVQWHPETMLEYDDNANKIFDKFIKECKIYNDNKN